MPALLTPLNAALAGLHVPEGNGISDEDFNAIRGLIYQEAGISLNDAKRALVCSRLAKRLRHLNLRSHAEYLAHLATRDPRGTERQIMVNCLTTNKTDFFREPHHFDFLRSTVFPEIERRAAQGKPRRLRIWSAGCSSGEEPYTIAITILEHFQSLYGWDIRILASDINTEVLRKAEEGIYTLDRIEDVDPRIKEQYLLRGNGRSSNVCQVRPEVRRLVSFRQINFMEDRWPIQSQFDVIFCRNVIIYFDAPTQDRLLTRMAGYLADTGYLMLGHSENLHRMSNLLAPQGNTIYRRRETVREKPAGDSEPMPLMQPHLAVADRRTVVGPLTARRSVSGKGLGEKAARCTGLRDACPKRPTDCPHFHTSCPKMLAVCPEFSAACLQSSVNCPKRAFACGLVSDRHPRQEIISGELFASRAATEISTVLGSCVAPCLYDPQTRIGGMTHFMLPYSQTDSTVSARYGVHAMELLINEIMKLGGDRRRLQAKVFGGGNVLRFPASHLDVGKQNVEFIRHFLATEKIPLVAERLGGKQALRVHFLTDTARAFVKVIRPPREIMAREKAYFRKSAELVSHPSRDDITLF